MRRMTGGILDPEPVEDECFDIIPNGEGENVREHLMERDGSDYEEPPRKRSRANTKSLLTPEGDSSDSEGLGDPPKPEEDLQGYNRQRLKSGLKYVARAKRRKITPRTQQFLALHKDAYKTALETDAPSEAAIAAVRIMDKVYCSSAYWLAPREQDEYEDLMQYVKLRRLELLANYGDYLGQELQEIRTRLKIETAGADPQAKRAVDALSAPTTWSGIANALAKADFHAMEENVGVACGVLGMDPSHMTWLIQEWADRNRVFHNQSRVLINQCKWFELALQLARDLKELPNVAPDPQALDSYEKVLLSIRDEYFEVLSRDNPDEWYPNEKAIRLLKDLVERKRKKEQSAVTKAGGGKSGQGAAGGSKRQRGPGGGGHGGRR